ncbi:SWIM zinc finger family protein [Haloarcula sp. CBA1127]|uniref:SWIM zinc finger family protein n=1 Tax=Haloarcula sp. CBA1127 TaxID=1765055 RepID=UPI00073F9116|nr:SWIM zinc finger family protein [Haloarcula sp. CBA1127]
MSRASRSWQSSDDLPQSIGGPSTLSMPDDWTLSTAWRRAQSENDRGGAINDAERVVYLSDGDSTHRVLWALQGRTLVADCDCAGYQYHGGWCAHVASLWWQWVRGQIVVAHLDTGRKYPSPPAWLRLDDEPTAFNQLTPAELDAYLTCDLGSLGVREYARLSGRSPGTIGNLLRSARDEMEGRR